MYLYAVGASDFTLCHTVQLRSHYRYTGIVMRLPCPHMMRSLLRHFRKVMVYGGIGGCALLSLMYVLLVQPNVHHHHIPSLSCQKAKRSIVLLLWMDNRSIQTFSLPFYKMDVPFVVHIKMEGKVSILTYCTCIHWHGHQIVAVSLSPVEFEGFIQEHAWEQWKDHKQEEGDEKQQAR